jgi:hypothetical protein
MFLSIFLYFTYFFDFLQILLVFNDFSHFLAFFHILTLFLGGSEIIAKKYPRWESQNGTFAKIDLEKRGQVLGYFFAICVRKALLYHLSTNYTCISQLE